MSYVYSAIAVIIALLIGLVAYFKVQVTDLELENSKLHEELTQSLVSLNLEQSKSKTLETTIKNLSSDYENLSKETKKLKTQKVIVKDCVVKFSDLNTTQGIPAYLGSIGK